MVHAAVPDGGAVAQKEQLWATLLGISENSQGGGGLIGKAPQVVRNGNGLVLLLHQGQGLLHRRGKGSGRLLYLGEGVGKGVHKPLGITLKAALQMGHQHIGHQARGAIQKHSPAVGLEVYEIFVDLASRGGQSADNIHGQYLPIVCLSVFYHGR